MDTELRFTIAGSMEDFMFGAMNEFRWRVYVSDEKFTYLQQQPFPLDIPSGKSVLARLYDVRDVGAFQNDFTDYLLDLPDVADSGLIISTASNFNVTYNAHTMMPVLVGTIMATFAITIFIVSLIVVRFRINNSIDEGMTNIGALKAMGYSNFQIVASILMQFGIIAVVGGFAGVLLSQMLLPFISTIAGPLLGFPWQPDFNILLMAMMVAVIVICVLLFSLLSTRRIYKLFPLIALRGGLTTHSFKRNFAPLDRLGGSLSFLLALKDVMNNKKQAIAIGSIVLCISMMATSGIASHYAINVNNEAFLTTIVGETFDLYVDIGNPDDAEGFAERVREMPGVTGVTDYHF